MESPHFPRRQFLHTATAVLLATTAAMAMATEPRQGPNIVLLMADEYRHDALGCAGNTVVQTPNLDRLAGQGVRFSRTYCQGPLCQPSRASLITGQYVHQHGVIGNKMNMDPSWPTMMKQLQQAGYVTAMVGKAHFAGAGTPSRSNDLRESSQWSRRFGLDWLLEEYDRGIHLRPGMQTPYTEYLRSKNLWDVYREESSTTNEQNRDLRQMYSGRVSRIPQEHNQTSFLADRAIQWLSSYKSDKPFFLWVSLVAPHPPLIDDAVWAERYKDVRIPPGPAARPDLPENAWGRYLRTWIRATGTATLTPEAVQQAARHYYGMVSLVDQKIGDIVKAVDERGWESNTWFFFTADHGEMLGEHGLMFKNVFYKGSVLVPNIIRPAGGMPARTVDSPVESIDITGTILDVAGTQLPQCQGQSLIPLMKGQAAPREVAYSELAGHQNKGNYFVMVATQRYRYLYDKENNIACELFDLEKDPDELHNLVNDAAYAGIRQDLHKKYLDHSGWNNPAGAERGPVSLENARKVEDTPPCLRNAGS